jgi:hypothetical protein
MQKTKFFKPYFKNTNGKDACTLKANALTDKAGVYFIRSMRTGKIVYVGHSTTQLHKTIYRHFQEWNDRQQNGRRFERKTYSKYGYEVRFIKTTAAQAERLERYFIQKLKPRDNPLKYELAFGKSDYEKTKPLADEAMASDWLPKNKYIDEEAPF